MESVSAATLQANTSSAYAELRAFLDGLTDSDLTKAVGDGWTVSTVLGHLAFWDSWVENRWKLFDADGAFDDFPDNVADLLNKTLEPQWLALQPAAAKRLASDAAESLTARIQSLDDAALSTAIDTGRSHLIDRSRHWNEHMDQVRRSLSR